MCQQGRVSEDRIGTRGFLSPSPSRRALAKGCRALQPVLLTWSVQEKSSIAREGLAHGALRAIPNCPTWPRP